MPLMSARQCSFNFETLGCDSYWEAAFKWGKRLFQRQGLVHVKWHRGWYSITTTYFHYTINSICLCYKHFNLVTITAWKLSVFRVFLVHIFSHSDWIWRDAEYLFIFSPNAGKCGAEKLQIQTLFTQWIKFWSDS